MRLPSCLCRLARHSPELELVVTFYEDDFLLQRATHVTCAPGVRGELCEALRHHVPQDGGERDAAPLLQPPSQGLQRDR